MGHDPQGLAAAYLGAERGWLAAAGGWTGLAAAAVASYREGGATWRGPADPPRTRQLGDLRWRGSGRGTLGGLPVVAHIY
jgi:hypothetical protein